MAGLLPCIVELLKLLIVGDGANGARVGVVSKEPPSSSSSSETVVGVAGGARRLFEGVGIGGGANACTMLEPTSENSVEALRWFFVNLPS